MKEVQERVESLEHVEQDLRARHKAYHSFFIIFPLSLSLTQVRSAQRGSERGGVAKRSVAG